MGILKAALLYFAFSLLITMATDKLKADKQQSRIETTDNQTALMLVESKEEPNMNKIQIEIEKLEANEERSEMDELMLHLLYTKTSELGDDASEEEVEEALTQARAEFVMHILSSKRAVEEEAWDEDMRENMALIRSAFEDMEVRYREFTPQSGVYAFELGLTTDGKKLQLKVYLEEDPKVCRIDAVYPFQADPEFVYPLCVKLATENYNRRYGALQYDASDNELSYRYSFPIRHGMHEDDFRSAFMAVLASAHASYDVVKQCAVGRFRRAEREEIICKAQKLIIELDQ